MTEPPKEVGHENLHPAFAAKLVELRARLRQAGIPFREIETFRTQERQAWHYASGRTRPGNIVTQKDGAPGLWPMDHPVVSERGKSRRSRHQSGLAADMWPERADGRVWCPPTTHEIWKMFRTHARALGLRSGGDWGDWPHVEWRGALPKKEDRK